MTSQESVAVMKECKEQSIAGKITFPEVVRRLEEAGVERYHLDLIRDETTYYLPCGDSHVFATAGPQEPIAEAFDAAAVEKTVHALQRGEIRFTEFLRRIMAAGCVGYFTQIAWRRVQYFGRTGDSHVEPSRPRTLDEEQVMQVNGILEPALSILRFARESNITRPGHFALRFRAKGKHEGGSEVLSFTKVNVKLE